MAVCVQTQLVGSLLGPPIVGWIYDADGEDYFGGAVYTAVCFLLAGVSLFSIPSLAVHDKLLVELIAEQKGGG
jgi:hypothetical protein